MKSVYIVYIVYIVYSVYSAYVHVVTFFGLVPLFSPGFNVLLSFSFSFWVQMRLRYCAGSGGMSAQADSKSSHFSTPASAVR